MSTSHGPATITPTPLRGSQKASTAKAGGQSPVAPEKSAAMRGRFVGMAVNMFWQLAVAVLVPLIAAVQIGKRLHAETAGVIIGLVLAVTASTLVMWYTMRAAAKLPVPKLTAAQKRAVKKQYDEEDEE